MTKLSRGDVLIWRKPTGHSGYLLVRAEYLYRTPEKIAVKVGNGETRFVDPNHLRRPAFMSGVPFSQVKDFQEHVV